jgi:hypothetical protein
MVMRQGKEHNLKASWKRKMYEGLILRSWWVLLSLGIGFAFYSHAMQKKSVELSELEGRLLLLQEEKSLVQEQREDLLLQIESQKDPEWIRLTLMKELGVVPEGQVKVHFKRVSTE